MWAYWLLWAALQPATACGAWCGPQAPECAASSSGRDAAGIEKLVLDEQVPADLPADRVAAAWLVYPGFEPFPAASGAFHFEAATRHGRFQLCLLPSVAARQRRVVPAAHSSLAGGLVLFSFDPSLTEAKPFPLDPAFATAARLGLLTAVQSGRLAELDRLLPSRAERLASAWNDFRRSPHVAHYRTTLFDALRSFHEPQPAFSRDQLDPQRFFAREQRETLRRNGHAIPGRCILSFTGRGATIELSACPLVQLAAEWNRQRPPTAGGLPALRAVPARQHEEIDGLTLQLAGVPPQIAARYVLGLLSAVDGLEGAAAR